jgi:hypothetical protein
LVDVDELNFPTSKKYKMTELIRVDERTGSKGAPPAARANVRD